MKVSTMLMIGAGVCAVGGLLSISAARIANDLAGVPVRAPQPPIEIKAPEEIRIDSGRDSSMFIHARPVPGGCLYHGRNGGGAWGAFAPVPCAGRIPPLAAFPPPQPDMPD